MTYAEHVEWARRRALECLDRGEPPPHAVARFLSDMLTHGQSGGLARVGSGLGEHSIAGITMLYRASAAEMRGRLEAFTLGPLPLPGRVSQ